MKISFYSCSSSFRRLRITALKAYWELVYWERWVMMMSDR